MAIRPQDEYPGQVITGDPGYPHGRAKNEVSQDRTGTPLEERIVNDLIGFRQALLEHAGIQPSGTPDQVGASQYLEAIEKLRRRDAAFTMHPNQQVKGLARPDLEDIAYHPNGNEHDKPQLVAVGGTGSTVLRSDRGDFWKVESGLSQTNPRSVAARGSDSSNVVWCVVGPSNEIETSTDGGVTWTPQTSAFPAGPMVPIDKIRWGNGLFVCIGDTSRIQTSPDGVTWTERTNPTGDQINDLHYSPDAGTWVIVGSPGVVLTSTDGITWTDRSIAGETEGFRGVTYDPISGLWCAAGSGIVYTSPDGVAWTDRSAAFPSITDSSIAGLGADSDGVVLAVGLSGAVGARVDIIGVSLDGGVTWVARGYDLAEPDGTLRAALWLDGRWFVVGDDHDADGLLLTSARVATP